MSKMSETLRELENANRYLQRAESDLRQERIRRHAAEAKHETVRLELSDTSLQLDAARRYAEWFAAEVNYLRRSRPCRNPADHKSRRLYDSLLVHTNSIWHGPNDDPVLMCDECREVWPCQYIRILKAGVQ